MFSCLLLYTFFNFIKKAVCALTISSCNFFSYQCKKLHTFKWTMAARWALSNLVGVDRAVQVSYRFQFLEFHEKLVLRIQHKFITSRSSSYSKFVFSSHYSVTMIEWPGRLLWEASSSCDCVVTPNFIAAERKTFSSMSAGIRSASKKAGSKKFRKAVSMHPCEKRHGKSRWASRAMCPGSCSLEVSSCRDRSSHSKSRTSFWFTFFVYLLFLYAEAEAATVKAGRVSASRFYVFLIYFLVFYIFIFVNFFSSFA